MHFSSVNRIAFVAICAIACLTGLTRVVATDVTETADVNTNVVEIPPITAVHFETASTTLRATQDHNTAFKSKLDEETAAVLGALSPELQTRSGPVAHPEPEHNNGGSNAAKAAELSASDTQQTERTPATPRSLRRTKLLRNSKPAPKLFSSDTVSERFPNFQQASLSNASSTAHRSSFSFKFSPTQPWTSVEVEQMDPARGDAIEYIPTPHLFDSKHPLKEGNHTWIIAVFEPGHRFSLDFTNLNGFYIGHGPSEKQFHSPSVVVLQVQFTPKGAAIFASELGAELELLSIATFDTSPEFQGAYPVVYMLTPPVTNRRLLWGEKVNNSLSFPQKRLPKHGRYYLSTLRSNSHDWKPTKPEVKIGMKFSHGINFIANSQQGIGVPMDVMGVRFTSSFSSLPKAEQHLLSRSIRNVKGLVSTPHGVMAFTSPESVSVWYRTRVVVS